MRENDMRPQGSYEMGWGERLGGSIKGLVTGVIFFLVGTGFLWWNEGKAVKTGDLLAEVAMKVEDLGDISKIDPSINGKLVYATGNAVSNSQVSDKDFEINLNAIKLIRSVKYYQWVETRHTDSSNNTSYTYAKKWVNTPVDSSGFKEPKGHQNNIKVDLKSSYVEADKVSFGAYTLSKKQIGDIKGTYKLTLNQFNHLSDYISTKFATDLFKVYDNKIYFGYDQAQPQIGDVEISYDYVPAQTMVSFIAQVNNESFKEYKGSNGKFFSRLDTGEMSMERMIDKEEDANTIWTWIYRVIGFFIVSAGIKMILGPIVAVAYILPFLGGITSGIVSVIGSLLGLAWSLIIIAIAWISYRPVLSLSLLGIAVLSVIAIFLFRKKKPEQVAPQGQNFAGQQPQQPQGQTWQQPQQPQNYGQAPQAPQAPQATQGWQPQNNAGQSQAPQATQGWQPPQNNAEPQATQGWQPPQNNDTNNSENKG